MLAKFVEEVSKRLLDTALKHPFGLAAVVSIALSAAVFLALQYFQATPEAVNTLQNPIFFLIASATALIVTAFLLKLSARVPRLIAMPVLALETLAIAALAVHVFVDQSPKFKVDVIYDSAALPSAKLRNAVMQAVQTDHFQLTAVSRTVSYRDDSHAVLASDALGDLATKLRDKSISTPTILVTSKQLNNSEYANLFYSVQGSLAILSVHGIADLATIDGQNLTVRYLAAMLPLIAMHAEASARDRVLLSSRAPDTEHGCLHDFSTQRSILLEKLSSDLAMCATESETISAIFGKQITLEYREILRRATKFAPARPAPTLTVSTSAATKAVPLPQSPTPSIEVLFGHDDSALDNNSKSAIAQFVTSLGGTKVDVYVVTGHADASESGFLPKISLRRAEVVKAFLVALGVPSNGVYVQGVGAGQPASGSKSVNEGNRRVTIEAMRAK